MATPARTTVRRSPAARVDPVWAALGLLFATLALVAPGQALDSARFTAGSLLALGPILAMAAALVAWLRASGADARVARVFIGRPGTTIGLASVVGTFSPLCGIEVIPLVSALLTMGVPLPPVIAFWLASPVTDPAMLVVTAAALGIDFAVAKTLAAAALGLAGGLLTRALQDRGIFASPLRAQARFSGLGPACNDDAPAAMDARIWRHPGRRRTFLRTASATALLMLRWMALAFAVESLMLAWVPAARIAQWLGHDAWAIPLAVLVGAPAYVNGYAALPLTAGLLELGMTPGAAMAFLIAGGVTSLPAAMAVYAFVRVPVFVWYLALAVLGSGAAGFAFEAYVSLLTPS